MKKYSPLIILLLFASLFVVISSAKSASADDPLTNPGLAGQVAPGCVGFSTGTGIDGYTYNGTFYDVVDLDEVLVAQFDIPAGGSGRWDVVALPGYTANNSAIGQVVNVAAGSGACLASDLNPPIDTSDEMDNAAAGYDASLTVDYAPGTGEAVLGDRAACQSAWKKRASTFNVYNPRSSTLDTRFKFQLKYRLCWDHNSEKFAQVNKVTDQLTVTGGQCQNKAWVWDHRGRILESDVEDPDYNVWSNLCTDPDGKRTNIHYGNGNWQIYEDQSWQDRCLQFEAWFEDKPIGAPWTGNYVFSPNLCIDYL